MDYAGDMNHRLLIALALVSGWLGASGDDVALVRISETWKFAKGTTAPPADWTQPAFNDSGWLTGWAGFSRGYYESTELHDMYGGYTSLFCRKSFVVTDPAEVKWLVLRVDYDSGFVAYLNGQEVARRGLEGNPGTPVPHTATATPHARTTYLRPDAMPEEIDLSSFAGLLVPGTNVLAIQAHSSELYDYYFALCPELLANFIRGPFIQNTSSNQTQVIWKTHVAASSAVEYGPTPALGLTATNADFGTNHVITLTGLEPGTVYYYRVVSTDGAGATARSPVESFRTFKLSGDLAFAVFGDDGSGNQNQYGVAAQLQRTDADLVLHTGDIVYFEFTKGRTDLRCLSIHRPHMQRVPYFFSFGNHDLYDYYYDGVYNPARADQNFINSFCLPTNSMTGTEHFYSFDHGDAHFVALFVPYLSQNTTFPQVALAVGSPQYRWLTNDLAQTTKPWKFLFFHTPPRTSAAHRGDESNGNGIPDRQEIEQMILPIAEQYGVQMIFNGHDHDFERLGPLAGVHFVVTGGGGYSLYSVTELDEQSAQFYKKFHCVRVAITNGTLSLQAIGSDGRVFDTMSLRQTPPPRQTNTAAWHTCNVDVSGLSADGDGNFNGQAFDFVGEPAQSVAGRNSNLGRLWVNYDEANLYVGLENVMLRSNQNVFLFVASPRQAGRQDLVGLGNGIVDPNGQGADGLDFLHNLAFSNFTPLVACVLGDERADGQYRGFARGGLPIAVGQGVFRLDAEFSDVPGARVQQFNRPAQAPDAANESASREANADFMVVAIPLSELNPLQPGDIVKVGAVVGKPGVDLDQQTRELDTGFVGCSLAGDGAGMTVLEGVAFQLAVPPLKASLVSLPGNQVQLRWHAEPGAKYDLEYSPDLGAFRRLNDPAFPRTAASFFETVTLTPPPGNQGFFRVKVLPP